MVASLWDQLARRLIDALGAQRGELIEVRDEAGNQRLLHAVLLALESIGAEPLIAIQPAQHIERLLATTPLEMLAERHQRYAEWLKHVDRSLTLIGAQPDLQRVADEALRTFGTTCDRLEMVREERRIPQVIAAIPTIGKAAQLGISHEELELRMMPALLVEPAELRTITERVMSTLHDTSTITIVSGPGYELRLDHGERLWLCDTGQLTTSVGETGAIVINLPAGSIYTTVLEESAEGDLFLPVAGPARAVHLHFAGGRVTQIEAASGADQLNALFDRHSGEPRRISHIGIGLNPQLHHPIGWTIVDEHIRGALFIAFGENRYMGGANASSLNIDFVISAASLRVDEQVIVDQGRLIV